MEISLFHPKLKRHSVFSIHGGASKVFFAALTLLIFINGRSVGQACGSECELVGDFDFSDYTTCSNTENPFEAHCVRCWSCSHGSPQIGDTSGNKYALIWSHRNGLGEGIQNTLFAPLVKANDNIMYVFEMKYRRDPANNDHDNSRPFSLNARLTTYPAAVAASPHKFQCDDNGGGVAPTPAAGYVLPITTVTGPANGYDWSYVDTCIYSRDIGIADLRILYIYPSTTYGADAWVNVDDIQIHKIDAGLGPDETCICTDSAVLTPLHCSSPGIPVTYAWYKDGVLIPNQTGSSLTVTPPSVTTIYSITITYHGRSVSDQIIVHPAPCPPPPIIIQPRPVQICANTNQETFHTDLSAVSYQWHKNNILQSGETNPSFTVYKDSGNDITVSVDATDQFGCTAHDSLTFHWKPQPEIGAIADDSCDANNLLAVTITIGNYDPLYDPYKVSFVNSAGKTTNVFTISGQSKGSYTTTLKVIPDKYKISVDNGAGTKNQCSGTAEIIGGFDAKPKGTKFDECKAGHGGNLNVSVAPPGNYTYAWLPDHETTAALTDKAQGTYTVTVTDHLGCYATKTVILDNNLKVVTTSQYASCVGANHGAAIVNVSGGSNLYTYIWNTGASTTATTAATNSISPVGAGHYTVTIISGTCRETWLVEVADSNCCNPPPPRPLITQVGTTLYCITDSSYASYQWYDSTMLITGATDTFLVITHAGNYNVKVSNADSCKVAAGINVELVLETSAAISGEGLLFTISPNPVGDKFTIYGLRFTNFRIVDMLGRVCQQSDPARTGNNLKSEIEIDVSFLPPGMYFAEVTKEGRRWVGKFVKE